MPSAILQDGLDIIKAWGFVHKQTYVWIKTKNKPLDLLKKEIINYLSNYTYSEFLDYSLNDLVFNKLGKKFLLSSFGEKFSNFNIKDILSMYMGHCFRNTHEICLIGSKGKIFGKRQNKAQRSVCFAPNLAHSAKPEDLQDSFDIMFPTENKLEIFGRRSKTGWTVIGNEAPDTFGENIEDSIEKLISR